MNFREKLDSAIRKQNSLLCIGLDPTSEKVPGSFFEFNKKIIDETHELVCGYKPNVAFYEARGSSGVEELKKTCDYIRETYPDLIIILDAKRGDIGSTNEGYVRYAFEYLQADAITLHPYLGREAIKPFLNKADKGCIILCRTSNPGAGEFQNLSVGNDHGRSELYKHVATQVSKEWNTNNNCLLVVGATYSEELAEVRKIVGDMPILVPGVGAQGGDLAKTLNAGLTAKKDDVIITVSRSVIYAQNPKNEAQKLRDEINALR